MGQLVSSATELTNISISQQPGRIAPVIHATIRPHLVEITSALTSYEPPQDVTFGYEGMTWVCSLLDATLSIAKGDGFSVDCTYYPSTMLKLERVGLKKKALVFLSAPQYEYNILSNDYDEDRYEILHEPSDVFTTDGWTIQDIAKEVSSRIGIDVVFNVPILHVPNPTVILERGTNILSFLQGLLPQGLTYLYFVDGDTVTISYHQTPTGTIQAYIPSNLTAISLTKNAIPDYNFIRFTGADTGYSSISSTSSGVPPLGGALGPELLESTSSRGEQTIVEKFPPETVTIDEKVQTISKTRTFRTGPDGEIFAIDKLTSSTSGAYTSYLGETSGKLEEVEETFEYENNSSFNFIAPRLTSSTKTTSRLITSLAEDLVYETEGLVFLLLDDFRIIPFSEYVDETVILAASQTYDEAEVWEESFTYTQASEADRDWYEGSQRQNTIDITGLVWEVNESYYLASLTPKEMLQQILSDMSSAGIFTVESIGSSERTLSHLARKTVFLSPGSYQFEEAENAFDMKSGQMIKDTRRIAIDGERPPGRPSQYRYRRLSLTLDANGSAIEGGGGSHVAGWGQDDETCIPYPPISIPTSNPTDFMVWAGLIFDSIMRQQTTVAMTSPDILLPIGFPILGVLINSFQIQKQGGSGLSHTMGGQTT